MNILFSVFRWCMGHGAESASTHLHLCKGTDSVASSPPTRTCSRTSTCRPPSACQMARSCRPTRAPVPCSSETPSSSSSSAVHPFVRPNRTIFDSDLIDVYVHGGGPRPPSSNSGKSASNSHVEGPPPTYSEVMGQTCPGSASFLHQHSNNAPPSNQRTASRSPSLAQAQPCSSRLRKAGETNPCD